ncbi:MAG TPA: ABC transporter ATP-binding protein [Actinomycetota bacterium]
MAELTLHDVVKSYGEVPALRGITLEVGDGELLVLVGPSGSGKSTALRTIAGLERVDGGTISIDGRDVTRLAASARDVAMVFQSYALFPHLNVRENLTFGPRARREEPGPTGERVVTVAEALGLGALLERKPRQLSGGERQRVALARAMVRQPAVFLMDEPLSNLDAQLRVATRAEIVRLQERLGTTTVYVTHDQVEALSMGHRVAVIADGVVHQVGTPDEVYRRPANTFVASFIGSPPTNLVSSGRDGAMLVWAGGWLTAPPHAPQDDCMIGVRPEHLHVVGSRWTATARPGDLFRARVDLIESAGDQSILMLEAGGALLAARVEPTFRPARDSIVEAWFDPDHVHLFDAVTGIRIDP